MFASILILLVNLCKHNKWFWSTSTDTDQFTIVFSCYSVSFYLSLFLQLLCFYYCVHPLLSGNPVPFLLLVTSYTFVALLSCCPPCPPSLLLSYYLVLFARYSSVQRIWKQGINKNSRKIERDNLKLYQFQRL